jgi:hypothetical protein
MQRLARSCLVWGLLLISGVRCWAADPGTTAETLYALPDGGVAELLAFIQRVAKIRPATAAEDLPYRAQSRPALRQAAERILQLEKDPQSEAHQAAQFLLTVEQAGSPRRQSALTVTPRGELSNRRRAMFPKHATVIALCLSACAALAARAAEEVKPAAAVSDQERVFPLQEVSAFKYDRQQNPNAFYLLRGQAAQLSTEPDKQIKTYPQLRSKRPYYGKVTLGQTGEEPKSGVEYHFVLDESGEKPAEPKPSGGPPQGPKPPEKKSLLDALAASLLGTTAAKDSPQPDVPPGPGPITYDRLYLDANRDLDLTNDPVIRPMAAPPAQAVAFGGRSKQTVVYEWLAIPLDFGPALGRQPFRLLPRLTIDQYEGKDYAALCFIAAVAREGRIQIGSRAYDALLAQPYLISGRFDTPSTGLYLTPVQEPKRTESWWGAEQLSAMRRVDGKYYTTSVTPTGDQMTVKRYEGDFGTFRLGPAHRDLKKLSMRGSLRSATAAVAVGDFDHSPSADAEAEKEFRLPVGDYMPSYLHIEFGRLQISLSDNYHSDGRPRDMGRPRLYAIQLRKDKPFVFDFSNKPEVMFASPAREQTFKPGDEVRVAAVLTDPGLGIMIRGLNDTSRKQKETYKFGDGKEQSYDRPLALDPTVTITNSSGKRVAEGKLPFG